MLAERGKNPIPPSKKGKNPLEPWDNAFFITINTGTSIPELKNGLNTVWNYLTSHLSEYMYGRKGSHLLQVKQHHRVEQGKKYHKIHLHATLVARTTGIGFLDFYKIRDLFNQNLRQIPGFKRINFQAKLIKNYNQAKIIQEYIDKDRSESENSDDE